MLMFEEIVGSSEALKTALSHFSKVAPTDSTVFFSGETGTGKELIARAVHKRSQRAERAFVSVNCAARADLDSFVFSCARRAASIRIVFNIDVRDSTRHWARPGSPLVRPLNASPVGTYVMAACLLLKVGRPFFEQ